MERNIVGWFEIYVDDIPSAKAFYEGVFELALAPLPSAQGELEMWCFPMQEAAPGSAGAIVKMDGCSGGGNSSLLYFTCLDCEVPQARVPQYGGQIVRPKFSIGQNGFIALVKDPAGNLIGLHSLK